MFTFYAKLLYIHGHYIIEFLELCLFPSKKTVYSDVILVRTYIICINK